MKYYLFITIDSDTRLFDRLVYKWLIEKDHDFDNVDVNKIKEAITFLEEKLDHNKKLVSDFISQMNDIGCLDKDLLELIYEVSQKNKIDFFDSSSMIREIYTYLTDTNYKTSIIFLNKEEKKLSNKKLVEEIISSNICNRFFSKDNF